MRGAKERAVVLQELRSKVAEYRSLALQQVCHTRHVAELLEVARKLLDGMDKPRGILILAARRERAELLECRDEHDEALESGDGVREVPLRYIQGLDVTAYVTHQGLALLRLALDRLDALKELPYCRLCLVEVRPRPPAVCSLSSYCMPYVIVNLVLLRLQIVNKVIQSREGDLVWKLFVDVINRVEIVCIEWIWSLGGVAKIE